MQVVHKVRSTWTRKVDKYVALTDFARRKFVSAGLPASMIACKPNFVPTDPGVGSGDGGYVLFVGRLSAEKGISTLLAAWQMLSLDRKLKIAGDGPMRTSVGELANRCSNIEWLGRRSDAEVFDLMRSAVAVVCPSEWYEGFPLVVIEAFASGAPVIASRIGGLGEIIEHGRTGLLFAPGSAKGLVEAIEWAFTHSSEMGLMRRSARAEYETKYTPERNYRMLMDIYRSAGVVTSDDR
jgi:glycosyltransferase involved in cell wall biosynthesis